MVYDASAKTRKDQKSLNECLYKGPLLLPSLCGVILRFRTYPIALSGDIEKAFLQLSIAPSDRDVTRFLWFSNPDDLTVHPRNISTYHFCRVPFGITSSPYLLAATIKHHLSREVNQPLASHVARNIYVDNRYFGRQGSRNSCTYLH